MWIKCMDLTKGRAELVYYQTPVPKPTVSGGSSPPACPGPAYHPGGAPAGLPGPRPVPLSSLHCAPAPGKTCCLLPSALGPSSPLPPAVARVVGASLGRELFSAEPPATPVTIFLLPAFPGTRRLPTNSPRLGFTCSLLQPQSVPLVSCLSPHHFCHHLPNASSLTPRTVLPPVGKSLGFLPESSTGSLKWGSHLPIPLPGSACSIRRREEERVRAKIRKGT